MAVCPWCNQEMTTAASCGIEAFHRHGKHIPLPRYRRKRGWPERCGDCGVTVGGVHHPGCDLADCPVCGCQMFSCGCRFDEDGPDDEDDLDGFDAPWAS